MTFGSRTVIQPVHPELGPVLPNYQAIAAIPRVVDPDERYEEEPRKVEGKNGGRESLVREIIITDQRESPNAYTGCSDCSKRTNLPLQKCYSCSVCSVKESICTERATFKFKASDDTRSMAFTTFNDDTERLFKKTSAEIYDIKEKGDYDEFKAIQDIISTTPFYIKVRPTLHLAQNNVLEWDLKTIELKEDPNTQEAANEIQGENETHPTKISIKMQNSELIIPTPNLKTTAKKRSQQETFTETLESPQQNSGSLKQEKSLGKRPMETEIQQTPHNYCY
ncbi:uncharacterized protein LOC110713485 [Chenopodium quinoa]|uniref:uncharacterized protein LOC110713485 n=1 Tax=Chenopodium quinoa TaxID=63459 RepID=UPI000B78E61B|nr:uncharacterized protein LOC110713485 [Chenopodium quinoa]